MEETVQDFTGTVDGKGYKASMDDPAKLPMALIPTAILRGIAAALGYGAKKYAPNNWRRGMKYSEVYSALQRHLVAWQDGEELDGESGLSHLDHAACCLAFLREYTATPTLYAAFDDRYRREMVRVVHPADRGSKFCDAPGCNVLVPRPQAYCFTHAKKVLAEIDAARASAR